MDALIIYILFSACLLLGAYSSVMWASSLGLPRPRLTSPVLIFSIVWPPFKNKKRRYNKTDPSKNAVVRSIYLREKYVQYSIRYYGSTNSCSCQCLWRNFVEGGRKQQPCATGQAGRLYIQTLKTYDFRRCRRPQVLLVGKHPKPFEQRFTLAAALRA